MPADGRVAIRTERSNNQRKPIAITQPAMLLHAATHSSRAVALAGASSVDPSLMNRLRLSMT
jgi:hypothetical protein